MNSKTRHFWQLPQQSAEAHRRWEREHYDSLQSHKQSGGSVSTYARAFELNRATPNPEGVAEAGPQRELEQERARGDALALDAERADAARLYTEMKLVEASHHPDPTAEVGCSLFYGAALR